MSCNWIPTNRVRGGFTELPSEKEKEYSSISYFSASTLTPGSYLSPTSVTAPSMTSLRPLPPPLDLGVLKKTPPPVIGGLTTTVSSTSDTTYETTYPGGNIQSVNTATTITNYYTTNRFNNGVVDVSLIPYMREIHINFAAIGLRPNRRVNFFFDNKDMTNFIGKANLIKLRDSGTRPLGGSPLYPYQGIIDLIGSGRSDSVVTNSAPGFSLSGSLAGWNSIDAKGNQRAKVLRRRRLYNKDRTESNVAVYLASDLDAVYKGGVLRTTESNITATIEDADIRTGSAKVNTYNSIILSEAFVNVPTNYWGTDESNVVTLLTHAGAGVARKIVSYNSTTRVLTFTPEDNDSVLNYPFSGGKGFDEVPSTTDLILDGTRAGEFTVTIAPIDATALDIKQKVITEDDGSIFGTFYCPAGRFLTGQRMFTISDDAENRKPESSTYAEAEFNAAGIQQTTQEISLIFRRTTTAINRTITISPPPPPVPPSTDSTDGGSPPSGDGNGGGGDPFAQTFFVETEKYPEGMFVSSIDVYFAEKDTHGLPVVLEIRPTVNGYPDSNYVIPGAVSMKFPDDVTLTDLPSVSDSATRTRFSMPNPIFLPPGEYALVLWSRSLEYEIWASELGQRVLGTNSYMSEQPYLGSVFKSQNGTAWTATQLEDMMFSINKCRFSPSGEVILYNLSPVINVAVDEIYTHTEQSLLNGTTLEYQLSCESSNVFQDFATDVVYIPENGRITHPANTNGYFKIKAEMTTTNPDISPVLYHDRMTTILFENMIDDAELINANFTIENAGTGYYANASNILLSITGTGNDDAVVYGITNTTGSIVEVNVASGGSGFTEDATVAVSATYTGPGSGAVISMSSELDPSGGTALCKYISRTVTLNEGFESADMKLFLTAYKPTGTDIHVYYKVKNSNDPESFESKRWFKMQQTQYLSNYSQNIRDYLELEFTPFGEEEPFLSISYSSGNATYTTFDQFAVKIILVSNDTTKFPVLRNMRAIAMPATEIL